MVNFRRPVSSKIRFLKLPWLLFLTPGLMFGRTRPAAVKTDGDYVYALAAADKFLHAWQIQDQEDGLVMLSDAAKQRWPEDRLEAFFASPENAGYEIGRGRKLKAGRYAFPVALLGNSAAKVRKRISEIVVMQSGKEDWEVDKLP
jgi:hypothetical protein